MTQQDFADWFCITRYTAWQILNQKRQLKADEIVKICMRFDVTADWLLGLSDIENLFEDAHVFSYFPKFHFQRGSRISGDCLQGFI